MDDTNPSNCSISQSTPSLKDPKELLREFDSPSSSSLKAGKKRLKLANISLEF